MCFGCGYSTWCDTVSRVHLHFQILGVCVNLVICPSVCKLCIHTPLMSSHEPMICPDGSSNDDLMHIEVKLEAACMSGDRCVER